MKLSSSCYVITIESYLASNYAISADDTLDLRFKFEPSGPIYLFDFSVKRGTGTTLWERELFPKVRNSEKASAYFDRKELNELLYGPSPFAKASDVSGRSLRVTADLPLEEVGGLLTLTDPKRLEGDKITDNFAKGYESIYIKLGPKGRTAQDGHILVFYYPSDEAFGVTLKLMRFNTSIWKPLEQIFRANLRTRKLFLPILTTYSK